MDKIPNYGNLVKAKSNEFQRNIQIFIKLNFSKERVCICQKRPTRFGKLMKLCH